MREPARADSVLMGDGALPVSEFAEGSRLPALRRGSKRLLALAGDERLVDQIRRGNDTAFEVAFERHGPAILAFCRHMLGSPDEAEDAIQHTFAAAYRELQRHPARDIALKPWLFTVARNRCLSLLRRRREDTLEKHEPATAGLAEEVERRAELRQLLADMGDLPEEQRAALLLAELADLSHAQVARVLDCEVHRVKALVHRARTGLIARRMARDTPCEHIREQLANLRGGSLRRTELRLHLRECASCRAYREEVRQQRQLLAAALPVAPALALKSSVLAAVGIGGGAAGGGMAAALGGAIGSATLAKMAVAGAIVAGGAAAGEAVIDSQREAVRTPPAVPGPSNASNAARPRVREEASARPASTASGARRGERLGTTGRNKPDATPGAQAGPRRRANGRGVQHAKSPPPGLAKPREGRGRGQRRPPKVESKRGRGPIGAPPAAAPVKRGPVTPKPVKPSPRVDATAPGQGPGAPSAVAEPGARAPKATGPEK